MDLLRARSKSAPHVRLLSPNMSQAEKLRATMIAVRFASAINRGRRSNSVFPRIGNEDKDEEEREEIKLKTLERAVERERTRRRTEILDIDFVQKRAEVYASQLPKKYTKREIRETISRLCKPTAAHTARVSLVKKVTPSETPRYTERKVNYNTDPKRFRGERPVTPIQLDNLSERLYRPRSARTDRDTRKYLDSRMNERINSARSTHRSNPIINSYKY